MHAPECDTRDLQYKGFVIQGTCNCYTQYIPLSGHRGSKSRNKVSVGEPAEGSLPIPNALYIINTALIQNEMERGCDNVSFLGI